MDAVNQEIPEDEKMVQYYLYLEALKRAKDEENEIMKSIAIKVQRYQDSLMNYLELYRKYVNIVELMETHNLLHDNQQKSLEKNIQEVNINRMIQQLKNHMNADHLNKEDLMELKENLKTITDFNNTKKMFQVTQQKDARIKGIDQSLSRIEVETKAAIDLLVHRIIDTFHNMVQPLE
ncbi:hypothetical protein ACFFRR_002451 [Megaselia abdita]